MKIVLVTQNDNLFLADALQGWLAERDQTIILEKVYVLNSSPTGRTRTKLDLARQTLSVFGFNFFLYYLLKKLKRMFLGKPDVIGVLRSSGISFEVITDNINNQEHVKKIRKLNCDVLISLASNQIFKSDLLNAVKFGVLNIHTSLLPKYRGLMPSFWALYNCEKETGVSVFLMNEGIDDGPILRQRSLLIGELTQEQLIFKTKRLGLSLLNEALADIKRGTVVYTDNLKEFSSYYGFPTRDDVGIFKSNGKRFF